MAIYRLTSVTLKLLSALGLLWATSICPAQDAQSGPMARAIMSHFQTVSAELVRHRESSDYGETISGTAISKTALAREVSLFKEALVTGLLKSPSPLLLALGHNLIVHDPVTGLVYLKALHETADLTDNNVAQAIVVGTVAAGEPGEALAVSELASKDGARRAHWAHYLEYYASFLSSAEPIQAQIASESDPAIKASLLRALSKIGSPGSLTVVRDTIEHATDDAVQTAAIFAYVELTGYDAISYMQALKPMGAQSAREREDALEWLKAQTSPESKHGREVSSDAGFVSRFGSLSANPVLGWLSEHELLKPAALEQPPLLAVPDKAALLELLIDARGFGLEAVKGALFGSLSRQDESALLRIRDVSFYAPNQLSRARLDTIGIMVRRIRQEL
jgi:hypothetical protein